MEKNNILIFLFSLIPGAGHMYLNMMKKGLVIMTAFFVIAIMAFGDMILLMPIVWFYSFFDIHNLKNFPLEERIILDNKFFEYDCNLRSLFCSKYMGISLVVIGIYNIFQLFKQIIYDFIRSLNYELAILFLRVSNIIPTVIISILIIFIGFKIIKSSKRLN